MARSRSSFELTSAIATASTLAKAERKPRYPQELQSAPGTTLVSFQPAEPAAAQAPVARPTPAVAVPAAPADLTERPTSGPTDDGLDSLDFVPATSAETTARQPIESRPKSVPVLAIPPPPPSGGTHDTLDDDEPEAKPRPPRLPDLSSVVSPIVRCERIVEWITEATSGAGVFIADADGLPIAGDIQDAESRIGASGLVASSIATLLQALPGQPSPLFELHIGEGPYFQLIGFTAGKGTYIVGLTRAAPLSPRQAHAIRLACRHAFGETLTTAAVGAKP
ncbi:MAG: hypothetical protein U0441_12005 [Polyangiaceae bacterium]